MRYGKGKGSAESRPPGLSPTYAVPLVDRGPSSMLAIELAALALLRVVLVDAQYAGRVELGPRAASLLLLAIGWIRLGINITRRTRGCVCTVGGTALGIAAIRRWRCGFGAARTHDDT